MLCNSERVNLYNLRATDLPSNKDLQMPGPAPIANELEIQSCHETHINTVRKYINHKCDLKGVIRGSEILTKIEIEGMKQTKDRIINKRWHIYQTDKSGRMCLN